MSEKYRIILVSIIAVVVLAVVFLISQSGGNYEPPRYLTWDYDYTQTFPNYNGQGSDYNMDSTNVWFNVWEKEGNTYTQLGATQTREYDVLTKNPALYDNLEHVFVVTAWDDVLEAESFYSTSSLSTLLYTEPVTLEAPTNLIINE